MRRERRFFLLPLLVLLNLVLLGFRAEATTYAVKAGGGGNYPSIQACANAAVAGDTCTVFAGTYNETVTPPHSGSAGNPITFQVNPGDCVTIKGWSLGTLSYITIGSPSGALCTNGGVTYSGFEITGGNIVWSAMNHIVIQNNYMHDTASGQSCLWGPRGNSSGPSAYVSVLNNIFTYCGGTTYAGGLSSSMFVEGNHWLIDGNNISHTSEGIQIYGDRHVVRNNVTGPVTASEEGPNHGDTIESSCAGDYPLTHMLYENNVVHDWRGANNHGFLLRDTNSCGMNLNIIRLSAFVQIGSDWISNDTNSIGSHVYNNSVSNTNLDSGKALSSLTFTHGDTNSKVQNNIYINSWQPSGTAWGIYFDPSSGLGFREDHNLFYNAGGSGTWQGPPSNGGNGYAASDIFNQDPKFVDPTADLHLQTGSPAVGAGGPLTTAVGGGAGTILTVADAAYFSDGYGITNVQPDWIRIGTSATVQISSINYATNVITLANSANWSSGTPIYLCNDSNGNTVLSGASPSVGAYISVGPAPPSDLKSVVN